MTYISDEHKLAYFAAPGTGSSAVIKALKDHGIGRNVPDADVVRDGRRVASAKHTTLKQMRTIGLDGLIDGYCKAVGVRNMFSWHVAIYLRNQTLRQGAIRNKKSYVWTVLTPVDRDRYIANIRKQRNMSFPEYLSQLLDKHDTINLHASYHEGMDFFMHQERLKEDFCILAARVGLPAEVVVPSYNVTNAMDEDKTYRDFYTPELIDYVYTKNAPFFAKFPEYSFDGLDDTRI